MSLRWPCSSVNQNLIWVQPSGDALFFGGLASVHLSRPTDTVQRPISIHSLSDISWWPHAPFQCTTWCSKTWHARVSIWMDGHNARGNNANRHPSGLVKMTASIAYNRVRSSRTSSTGDRKIKQTLSRQRKAALDLERCEASQRAVLQFRAFYSQVINLI